MRKIDYLICHCSATQPNCKVETIINYWKEVKGWVNPGYHFIIESNGTIHNLLPVEQISNGVQGHNYNSINVCYIGGVDKNGKSFDTRTPEQKESLIKILKELKQKFPNAQILGHRDLSPDLNHNGKVEPCEWLKSCPSFDAKTEYKEIH